MRYPGVDSVVAAHERPVALVKVSHEVDDIGAVVETLEYWDGKGSWHDAGQADQQFFSTIIERDNVVVRLRAEAFVTQRGVGVRRRVYELGLIAGDKVQLGDSVYSIKEIHDATYYTGIITVLCGKVITGA